MSTIEKTVIVSETTGTDDSFMSNYMDNTNKQFIAFIFLLVVVFLLILIVANNKSSIYFTSQLPSFAPSLSTWAFLLGLVFFFVAYSLTKAYQQPDTTRANIFALMVIVILILILVSVFLIFQSNSFRGSFWTAVAALIITIIAIFYIGGCSRSSSGWLLPLLLLEILFLVESWQVIQLNNY